jgi:hypothetical protein
MKPRLESPIITISMAQGLVAILVTIALTAALITNFYSFEMLGLAGILGGVLIGIVMFLRGQRREEPALSDPVGVARIDSSKIPIRGGIGAGILILILLSGALLELPELRLMAAPGIVGGLVFGAILLLWRRSHA